MLGAQSVPRFTDTSAGTTAPPAAIAASTINCMVKASPLIDQTHFKFVDVSYSGSVNFLLRKAYIPESRCYNRLGSDSVNSATTVLEKRSQAPFAPGKRRCRVLDAPVHRPVERQNRKPWDFRNMSGSSFLARRLSR